MDSVPLESTTKNISMLFTNSIKIATKEDVKRLCDIENSIFDPSNYPLSKKAFNYHVKKNHIYVLLKDNIVAGYILFFKFKKQYRIYSLAIAKEYQKNGFGVELIKGFLNFIKEDPKDVFLEVRSDNEPAIKLYKKLSFSEIKKLEHYYLDGTDGLKMKLLKKDILVS